MGHAALRVIPATAFLAVGLGGCITVNRGAPAPTARSAPLAAAASPSTVEAGTAALDAFLRDAEAAAAPYRSLERAVAAGYRRLGPSFPGMGEHWIHPGLIVEGRVVAERPPVLCYARVDGEPRLVALAFAVPLEGDEAPPVHPAGRDVWHDHADHVDEETLLLGHPASHHGAEGPRLAMFHAWLWLDNADGVLAQNNWRLPFLQAGVDAESLEPSADAARALSLHTAGPEYYRALFRAAAGPADHEMAALGAVLEEWGVAAGRWAEKSRDLGRLDPGDLAELELLWGQFWADVTTAVEPATGAALSTLR